MSHLVLKMDNDMTQAVKDVLTSGLDKLLRNRIISMGEYTTFGVLEALYIIYQYQNDIRIDNIEDRISSHTKRYEVPYYENKLYDEKEKLLQDIRNDLYIKYIAPLNMPKSQEEFEKQEESRKLSEKEYLEKQKPKIENERIERERRDREFEEMQPVFYRMDRERRERERIENERKERESRALERQREIRWRNMQKTPSGYDQVMYYYLTKDL